MTEKTKVILDIIRELLADQDGFIQAMMELGEKEIADFHDIVEETHFYRMLETRGSVKDKMYLLATRLESLDLLFWDFHKSLEEIEDDVKPKETSASLEGNVISFEAKKNGGN